MRASRLTNLLIATFLGLLLVAGIMLVQVSAVQSQELDEAGAVKEKAAAAEESSDSGQNASTAASSLIAGPLFVGVGLVSGPAYTIDVSTSLAISAFVGTVWGAAYDGDSNRVLFSDGVDLYEWPIDGSVNFLGTVTDTLSTTVSMQGLAYYNGNLYASKVDPTGEGEGIYMIDLVTLAATRVISYIDDSMTTIGGIDADPDTGILYGTNDAPDLRGLVQINADGTITLVAPYLGGETDVDGLAVGGGDAYLITDDNTPPTIDVFNFGLMTYTGVVSSPWTSEENFAGGAWITPSTVEILGCNGPAVTFDTGVPSNWITATTTGPVFWTSTDNGNGCIAAYEAGGTPPGACADADATNGAGDDFDTEMWTNSFDLSGQSQASLSLQWRHLQINNSVFSIDVSTDGGGSWANVLSDTVGNPGGAAGDFSTLNLDAFAGNPDVRTRFRFTGDDWDWYAQVDDVSLSCAEAPIVDIDLEKTVGLDANACAETDSLLVEPGTEVFYCYELTNMGTLSLTVHDLEDSALGTILSGFDFALEPAASVWLTASATMVTDTMNTATWTAYNPGPTDVVTATDTATVTVMSASLSVDPSDFEVTVALGTSTTLPLDLINSGTGPITFDLSEEAGGYTPPPPLVSLPASDGNFPRGSYAASAGLAPADGVGVAAGEAPADLDIPLGSDTYAWNSQSGPYYTIFDLDVPGTLPNIANFDSGNFVGAGEYVEGAVIMIDTGNTLYAFEPASGAQLYSAPISPVPGGGETFSGLAYDPTTGVVYGSTTNIFTSSLYTVDVATGAISLIGPITNSPGNIGIAIDGAGNLWGFDIINDSFFAIDKATGAGTNIGSLGFDANFGQGMCYDAATDAVYLVAFNNGSFQGELRVADPVTGNTTLVGVLGDVVPGGLNQLGFCGTALAAGGGIPWLSEDPITGTVDADSTLTVDLTFDATVVSETGTYTGTLTVNSDDPINPMIDIPVVMHVISDTAELGVTVSAAVTEMDGDPGTSVMYEVEVTNTGNVGDAYTLSSAGNAWTTMLSDTSVILDAGETTTVTVIVDIPVGSEGDSDTVTVTATSDNDGAVSDSVDLTTSGSQITIWLPLVFKAPSEE